MFRQRYVIVLFILWNTHIRCGVTQCINSPTKCYHASVGFLDSQVGVTAWPNSNNPKPFQSGYANISMNHRCRIYWDDSQGWKYIK